ncbi:MAG TPA: VOC family protein [Microcella sp.]|nr:VOC family protein [Microcella sp.]
MAKVEHFEIPVENIERARAFYREVLEFTYEPWDADMGMLNQPDGEGINGDLHIRGSLGHPTVVFTVDDLEETIDRARRSGGELIGDIQPMGETSRWAYIRDSEGNTIGLFSDSAG